MGVSCVHCCQVNWTVSKKMSRRVSCNCVGVCCVIDVRLYTLGTVLRRYIGVYESDYVSAVSDSMGCVVQ